MACTDRDLALSLSHLSAAEVAQVTSRLSKRKAARVLSEIHVEERRRIDEQYIVMSLQIIIGSLEQNRLVTGSRSYFRPHTR
jgi:hypothetical protein